MAVTQYSVVTSSAVALAAATAKSVIGVAGTSGFGVDLRGIEVSFDGVTASAVPGVVELCYSTFGANAPGTNSTTETVRQENGRSITAGFTAARNWTTEPTTLTVIRRFTLTPTGGTLIYDFPLGTSPDSAVSEGFVIRCTYAAVVNVNATLLFGRC